MNPIKQQIFDLIKKYETIIIHRHIRADADAYGSQCGLAEILRASFPEKKIFAVGTPVNAYKYLATLDRVSSQVWNGALVIVTDTANLARIDDERYRLGEKLIKIDHHPNKEPFGDICWVDETASSTSEMIFDLYKTLANAGLICTSDAARLLYAGIIADTGRFLFGTSSKTLAFASELISYDFDKSELFKNMYEEAPNMIKLQGYILENFSVLEGVVASIFITKKTREKFDISADDCSRFVHLLSNIKGIKVWVMFTESEQIRVNIRSKAPVINHIAEKYGGGGHRLASGANITSWEKANEILADLLEVCR